MEPEVNRNKTKSSSAKVNRLSGNLKRLEEETKKARERLREVESEQAKIQRMKKRRRIENEQRLLGEIAYSVGLAEIRVPKTTKDGNQLLVIDADLIAGALDLLASQMNPVKGEKRAGKEELEELREVGRKIRKAYHENPDNQKFRIPVVGIVDINNKGD